MQLLNIYIFKKKITTYCLSSSFPCTPDSLQKKFIKHNYSNEKNVFRLFNQFQEKNPTARTRIII